MEKPNTQLKILPVNSQCYVITQLLVVPSGPGNDFVFSCFCLPDLHFFFSVKPHSIFFPSHPFSSLTDQSNSADSSPSSQRLQRLSLPLIECSLLHLATESVMYGPVTFTSPVGWSETRNLWPHPRPTDSEPPF